MHIDFVEKITFINTQQRAATRLLGFTLGAALLAGSQLAAAAPELVFDRGLPNQNLNNSAGIDRSNVEWADVETSPETPWLPGDDFTLAGNGSYVISTIRVWSTDDMGLNLRGGVAGGPISLIADTYTATPVTYVNAEDYQTAAGDFLPLYQIDFSVKIPLDAGITYQYFLDGPSTPSGSDFMGVHLHASNAAASGSTQMGADDTFLFLGNDGTVYTWNTMNGDGTYCPGCVGWAKTSDANVQVFAEPVAPPAQALVFDRGLPSANLNNAAGADRSNVEWADIETSPETPWLPGDDFTLAGSGHYVVKTLRVWSTDMTGLNLRGGIAGGPIAVVPNTYTVSPVTYANSESYQTAAGDFLPLYQIDFSVDIPLDGGVKYQYFLDGPATPSDSDFMGARLHASNAASSGSNQSGADDTFLFLGNDGTVYTWNTQTGDGTYCPGCVGWGKTSDANVQVFAEVAAPLPQDLVFDRGLPTANLNNAADTDRSNVEWADVETLPETPWLPGDDFTFAGNGSYVISTIRVWSTDNVGLSLRGGVAGGPINVIASTYTATAVTYANAESYQTAAGDFLPLYQIDFSVKIPLDAGVTYQYFLDGPATPSDSDFMGARLHASNAAASGSTQMGADDTFLFLGNDGTVYTWNTMTGDGTYCPGCIGWGKTSDGNVQVFAQRLDTETVFADGFDLLP
jgi:WD40 repeat protein